MIKILSKKAYEALMGENKKFADELKELKKSYNNLLEKHEMIINSNIDLEKCIKNLKKKVEDLTPARDERGRFVSKKK